jgi:hypothetical protein
MNTTSAHQTRAETVLAAHECDWNIDAEANRGHCACGLTVANEDEWARHAGRAVVSKLWTPTAEQVGSIRGLAALPERSTVLARPGRDSIVCRRLVLGDLTMSAWCDLTGSIRLWATLLPAVVLDRGPAACVVDAWLGEQSTVVH